MKCIIFICITFALLLSACGSSQPTPTATATSLPTKTPVPTVIETPTPTVPMIEVEELEIPDPKISNSDLFDYKNPDSPLVRFANAIGIKPEDIGDLKPELKTGTDGKQHVFLVTEDFSSTTNFDETSIPLLFAMQKESGAWVWSEVGTRALADIQNIVIEALGPPDVPGFEDFANQIISSGPFNNEQVYGGFDQAAWHKIIDDWDKPIEQGGIKAQLDAGIVPAGFNYSWEYANQVLDYANAHNMTVRGTDLFHGFGVPDSLYNGGFSKEEVNKIMEFMVKSTVLQFNGKSNPADPEKAITRVVHEWDVGEELAATKAFQHNNEWTFYIDNIGYEDGIVKVSNWISQANLDAKQALVEDGIFQHLPEDQVWEDNFDLLINTIIKNNLPITIIDIENNFTVFNPPDFQKLKEKAKEIKDKGFILSSELTVVKGNPDALSWNLPAVANPPDPEAAKTEIYGQSLQIYLDLGNSRFGFGVFSDSLSWYDMDGRPNTMAGLLDAQNRPTRAFYKVLQVLYANIPSK